MFPFYAKAHYNVGVVLAEKGRADEAIAEYNETLRIEPDNADAHYALGVTYGPKGMLDKAVTHLEAAVRLAPGNPAFRTDLARAYHFLGDDIRAEQEIRTAANLREGRTGE